MVNSMNTLFKSFVLIIALLIVAAAQANPLCDAEFMKIAEAWEVQEAIDEGHSPKKPCADEDKETPLHIAAQSNAHEVAALLIEKRADINAKDNKGRTPLDFAKLLKAHDVIRLLEQ